MSSELRFEQLLNAISEYAVFMLDTDGNVEFANAGAKRIFGEWNHDVIGSLEELCPLVDQDPALIEESLRSSAAKIGLSENYGIREKPDGSRIWIHATYSPILEKKTLKGFSVVLRDLTEKRLAEAKYKSLVDSAPDSILLIDNNGNINLLNEKSLSLFGYQRHDLLGKNVNELFHANSVSEGDLWHEWLLTLNHQENELLVQSMGRRNDGASFPAEVSLKAITGVSGEFLSCSVRDVTNRNQLNADLSQANKKLKLIYKWLQGIIDSTPNLIAAVDSNLSFVAFNKSYALFLQKYLKINLAEGDSLVSVLKLVPDEFKAFFSDYQEAVGGKTFETEHRTKITGRPRHYKIAYRPITNEQGVLIGATQMVYDISTHREYEEKLSQALMIAESSVKLKQDFLANMSHEIRTPMNAIIGFTRLLIESKQLDEDNESYALTIYKAAEDLLVIINDILDFSKMEAGKVVIETVPFDLKLQLKQLKRLFSYRTLDQNIDVRFSIDAKIPDVVISDPIRINQIMTNLIGNAVKFTPEGNVTVTVKVDDQTDDFCVIKFEVTDTGIGIKPEQQTEIFTSFHQADSHITRQFGGTGLGLSIVKNLVDLLEGTISLKSVLGEGSTFTVYLPIKIGNTSQEIVELENQNGEAFLQLELRILLAEDNRNNQVLGKKILNDFGFLVDLANNGQEALDLLNKNHYDLVLMDIQMPVMDGLTALSEIRKIDGKKGKIPVVALTAHAMKDELNRYIEEGMNACVNKPYTPKQLIKVIIDQVHKK